MIPYFTRIYNAKPVRQKLENGFCRLARNGSGKNASRRQHPQRFLDNLCGIVQMLENRKHGNDFKGVFRKRKGVGKNGAPRFYFVCCNLRRFKIYSCPLAYVWLDFSQESSFPATADIKQSALRIFFDDRQHSSYAQLAQKWFKYWFIHLDIFLLLQL